MKGGCGGGRMPEVAWLWLGAIGCWTLACSALLAAFSTFDIAWAALLVGGAAVTLGRLGAAVVLSVKRRWSRRFLLCWAAWPLAVGAVWLLHLTDLPLTLRVVVSRDALSEFVDSGRTRGRACLVHVFDSRVREGCAFLTAGYSLDGIAGLVHVPDGSKPPSHPDFSMTDSRHLAGPWWYFQTHT